LQMSTPQAKFSQLSRLKYKEQAVWFLNGFWGDGVDADVANKIWDYSKKFVELDLLGPTRKGEEGNELDQFWSAKFLEDMDAALPAIQRKEALRTIDQDSNGKMSLIEYLAWKYQKGVKETAESPQGDNTEAIKRAQEAVERVAAQMSECERKLEAQKEAKDSNEKAKDANDKAIAQLKQAERELAQAEQELESAVADLRRQEEEYKNKCQTLEAKSKDQSSSLIQRGKASNELAQLKGEDPLPLRKAKITQEAALRKVQKQKKATEEARLVTESKGRELEEAGRKLEQTSRELERAIRELEQAYASLEMKMAEAQEELEIIKNKPGGGKGAIWWLQRELFEVDYRLQKAKQKFEHSKPFSYSP